MGWCELDWSVSRQGPVEGSCEHGNKYSACIECWEIRLKIIGYGKADNNWDHSVLEWLHNWRILKKSSAPWSCYYYYYYIVSANEPMTYRVVDSRKVYQKLNSAPLYCLPKNLCPSHNNSPMQFCTVMMSGCCFWFCQSPPTSAKVKKM
jgi:hypothetical protein